MKIKLSSHYAELNGNAIKNKLVKKYLLTAFFASLFLCMDVAFAGQSGWCVFKAPTMAFANEYEKLSLEHRLDGDICRENNSKMICTFSWSYLNNTLKTTFEDITYKAPIADAPFFYPLEFGNYSVSVHEGMGNQNGTLSYTKDDHKISIPIRCTVDGNNHELKMTDKEKNELQNKLITDSCILM